MPEDLFKDITAGLENLEKQANNTAQAVQEVGNSVENTQAKIENASKEEHLIYDTETTSMYQLNENYQAKYANGGTKKTPKIANGVTFSGKLGSGKIIDVLMDYGNDEINLENVAEAVNIRNNQTGELIDSAKQLRKRFKLAEDGIIKFTETEKERIIKDFKKHGKTADELYAELSKSNVTSVSGFNNSGFDDDLMRRFAKTAKSPSSQEGLRKIFNYKNSTDYREEIIRILDNKLKVSGKSKYLKGTSLQSFVKMITGSESSSAHEGVSDVESTELVKQELGKKNNKFEVLGEAMSRIVSERGIKADTYNTDSEYNKVFQELMDIISVSTEINTEDLVASYNGNKSTSSKDTIKTKATKKKEGYKLVSGRNGMILEPESSYTSQESKHKKEDTQPTSTFSQSPNDIKLEKEKELEILRKRESEILKPEFLNGLNAMSETQLPTDLSQEEFLKVYENFINGIIKNIQSTLEVYSSELERETDKKYREGIISDEEYFKSVRDTNNEQAIKKRNQEKLIKIEKLQEYLKVSQKRQEAEREVEKASAYTDSLSLEKRSQYRKNNRIIEPQNIFTIKDKSGKRVQNYSALSEKYSELSAKALKSESDTEKLSIKSEMDAIVENILEAFKSAVPEAKQEFADMVYGIYTNKESGKKVQGNLPTRGLSYELGVSKGLVPFGETSLTYDTSAFTPMVDGEHFSEEDEKASSKAEQNKHDYSEKSKEVQINSEIRKRIDEYYKELFSNPTFLSDLVGNSEKISEIIKLAIQQIVQESLGIEFNDIESYIRDLSQVESLKSDVPSITKGFDYIESELSGEDIEDYEKSGARVVPFDYVVTGKNREFLSKKEEENLKSNQDKIDDEEEETEDSSADREEQLSHVLTIQNEALNIFNKMIEKAIEGAPSEEAKKNLESLKEKVQRSFSPDKTKGAKRGQSVLFNEAAGFLTYGDTKREAARLFAEKTGKQFDEDFFSSIFYEDEDKEEKANNSLKAKSMFDNELARQMTQNGTTVIDPSRAISLLGETQSGEIILDEKDIEMIEKAWNSITVTDPELRPVLEQVKQLGKEEKKDFFTNLINQLNPNVGRSANLDFMSQREKEEMVKQEDQMAIPNGLSPKQRLQRYYSHGLLLSSYGADFNNENGLDTAIQNARTQASRKDLSDESIQKILEDLAELVSLREELNGSTIEKNESEIIEQEKGRLQEIVEVLSKRTYSSKKDMEIAAEIYDKGTTGISAKGQEYIDEQLKTKIGEENFSNLTKKVKSLRVSNIEKILYPDLVKKDKPKDEAASSGNSSKDNNSPTIKSSNNSPYNLNINQADIKINTASISNGTGTLSKENKVYTSVTEPAKFSGFKSLGEVGNGFDFESRGHVYSSNGESFLSTTQLRDLLWEGKNPGFGTDIGKIEEAITRVENGKQLTAQDVGMSEKDFSFYAGVKRAGLKGDISHSIVDTLVKNGAGSLLELKEKSKTKYTELVAAIEADKQLFLKYGGKEEDFTVEKDVASYFKMLKENKLNPKLSERKMAYTISGNKGDFNVGTTLDQVYFNSLAGAPNALFDTKTGAVKGYESFQLTSNLMGLRANAESLGISEEDLKKMGLYIADVKKGMTTLVEYLAMSDNDFYSAVSRAYEVQAGTASPFSEEEKKRVTNLQLKTGRYQYTPEGAISGDEHSSSKSSGNNIRYLTSAEMLGSTETKEAFLQEGKNNQAIRAYSRILEKQLKTTQEIYSVNAQIDRLSSMDGNKAKEQLELLQKKAQHQAEILQSLDKERKLIEDNVTAGKFDEKQVAAVAEIQEIYRNQLEGYRAAGTYEGQNASIKTDELTYKQAEASYLSALKDKGNLQWRQTKLNTLLSDRTISADVKAGYESQLQEINSQLRPYAQNPSTDLSSEGLKNLTPDENGMYKIEWFDRAKKSMVEYYGTLQQVQEMAGQVQLEQGKINVKIGQAATPTQKSLGLFTSILTGFKASLRNLTDYSLAYMIIGKIKQSFQQLIQTTKELDKVMVDLQIVTDTNRKEAKSLLGTYNELALEIGRSTTSVATASNDWLRAGYEGEEAADLTKASMYLSVLGMEDSAQATTQLISSLKGWKIEASEVMNVVDKLTVTICGVCTVMCIGHKTNCR